MTNLTSNWPYACTREALLRLQKMSPEDWRKAQPKDAGLFAGLDDSVRASHRVLARYKPSPAAVSFLLAKTRFMRVLIRAGNRVGKSEHGAAYLAAKALCHPNGRYRAVGVTAEQVRLVVGRLLAKYIPASALMPGSHFTPENGWSKNLIRLRNGAEIQLKSYEQERRAHAGNGLHGIWLDEPPPEDIFIESEARLRDFGGWMVITCTPAGYPVKYLKDLVEAEDSAWVEYVIGYNVSNCPWYTVEDIEENLKIARKNPQSYDQTVNGAWEGITLDRYFTGFDYTQHLQSKDSKLPVFNRGLWVALDHGQGLNRQVALFLGCHQDKDGKKKVHVFREFLSGKQGLTAAQIAKGIVDMIDSVPGGLAKLQSRHIRFIGDNNSAGLGRIGRFNQEIEKELAALGYPLSIASPNKRPGSVQDGEALLNNIALDSGLTADPSCLTLKDSLAHYKQGSEKFKDLIDTLRYGTQDLFATDNTTPRTLRNG